MQKLKLASSVLLMVVINACAVLTIGYDQNNLEKIVERGAGVIAAIEKFKADNGNYPNSIKELIPKYLEKKPTTGITPTLFLAPFPIPQSGEEEAFQYLKYKEQDPLKDPVQSGYRLLVVVDPMSFLDDENIWKCLLYRSSKKYPKLRLEQPKEKIGEWSIVLRANGSALKSEEDHYDYFLSY